MNTKSPQSNGGRINGQKLRKAALAKYYANPSKCFWCGIVIEVKPGHKIQEAQRQHFCGRQCAGRYNAVNRHHQRLRSEYRCADCGKPVYRSTKMCKDCQRIRKLNGRLYHITKGELFQNKHYAQAREFIRKHAYKCFWMSTSKQVCKICGYSKHVEVSHIKSVAEFQNSATVLEINNVSNLVALCPTHHWEWDNGVLDRQLLMPNSTITQTSMPATPPCPTNPSNA